MRTQRTALDEPYYADDTVTLHHGDTLDTLTRMPAASVACVVTSPPYWGALRDYGVPGQYGTEDTPEAYIARLTAVFTEVHRVLADDGTLWLNLGDTTREKNLLGMPWRVALAIRDAGPWLLRNDVIWNKPNAMPESVTDRLANRHEHLFLLTKSARYWFDLDAVREPYTGDRAPSRRLRHGANKPTSGQAPWTPDDTRGRNPGDVWTIATRPSPQAHGAVFPLDIPERCIKAGCKPGGTVLDPFSGSGTTGVAARRLGRAYVGIDLNPAYLDLSKSRFAQGVLPFAL